MWLYDLQTGPDIHWNRLDGEVFFRSRRHLHDFCPAVHFSGWSSRGCEHEPQAAHVSPPRSSWAWTRPVGSWLPWKVCFEILRIKDFWNHLWQHHVNATFAFTANLPAICGIIKVMQGCQSMSAFVNRAILIFWLRVHLDGAMLVLRDEIHSQSLIQNICPFLNSNVPPAPGLIQLEICLSWEMPSSIHLLSTLLLYSGNRLHLQL